MILAGRVTSLTWYWPAELPAGHKIGMPSYQTAMRLASWVTRWSWDWQAELSDSHEIGRTKYQLVIKLAGQCTRWPWDWQAELELAMRLARWVTNSIVGNPLVPASVQCDEPWTRLGHWEEFSSHLGDFGMGGGLVMDFWMWCGRVLWTCDVEFRCAFVIDLWN